MFMTFCESGNEVAVRYWLESKKVTAEHINGKDTVSNSRIGRGNNVFVVVLY